MTDINWSRLRTWEGTQQNAFEKLCTQLAMREPAEKGARFIAKGNPDAGVECYWRLPNGDEWGWQAKFFTNGPPTKTQWQDLTESCEKALEKHARLTIFTVCIPQDRADPRDERSHFMDKWDEHVARWEKLAKEQGRQIEFRYWGSSEIFARLAADEHRGRRFFWFNEEYLTPSWFEDRLEEQEADEPRYTPDVDVELPVVRMFDALGRTEAFEREILAALGKVRRRWQAVARSETTLAPLGEAAKELAKAGIAVMEFMNGFVLDPEEDLGLDALQLLAEKLFGTSTTCEREIVNARKALKPGAANSSSQSERYMEHELYSLRELSSAAYSLSRFLGSEAVACTGRRAALLRGPAGAGKTHLLFDVARKRLEQNLPTVVLLGKHFREGEPWAQISAQLHLGVNRDEFLGALEAAAQASGRRAMILIDAINEGDGRRLWKDRLNGFLTSAARFRWAVVVVAIRTTYEAYVIPANLGEDVLMRIDHEGFEGVEYEATEIFFRHFGIETPTVPLLHPEFSNPLFLRLLCEGLRKAALTTVPRGFRGISQLFKFLEDSTNQRLAEILDYAVERNLVHQALRALAAKMLSNEQHWLSFDDAEEVCQKILSRPHDSKSLCRNLIHEGLLRKECSRFRKDDVEEGVMFAYERLGDHLVASQLLDEHVAPEDPRAAFAPDQPLHFIAESEQACWRHRGLIEALSIQLPERFNVEFAEVFSARAGEDPVVDAFLDSLAWRSSDAFSEATRKIVNAYVIRKKRTHDEFLRILLHAAPDPDHPYNADFLHKHLTKYTMARRDAWWSVFLHEEGTEHSSVARLINWAWTREDELEPDSLVLYGAVLCWFLATSDRRVRDAATKALVNLFTARLDALHPLLERFIAVDDPYVLERLMAATYGAALRTRDLRSIRDLAQAVYVLVFQDANPPVHILTRDYARSVIEFALHLDETVASDVDLGRVRPPYNSEWNGDVPSEDVLRAHPAFQSDRERLAHAGRRIAFSVLDWDFGRYIIEPSLGHWSSRRLDAPDEPSPKERTRAFETSLTRRQAETWAVYKAARRDLSLVALLSTVRRGELPGGFDRAALEAELSQTREAFRNTIRGQKRQLFETVIDPYLHGPPQASASFDPGLARRWILNRVIELGWKMALHGEIDAQLIDEEEWGRSAPRAERIGKKYQWIAYHEFLARVSDNFRFLSDAFQEVEAPYNGPWQVSGARDIDPSLVLRRTGRGNWDPDSASWWFSVQYKGWPDHSTWLGNNTDLPNIRELIEVRERSGGDEWLSLDGSYTWEEPTPADEERYENARCQLWLRLHGYLLHREDIARAKEWASEQDFFGAWMPEAPQAFRVYEGEYHWSPAYMDNLEGNGDAGGWKREGNFGQAMPCHVLPVSEEYSNDGSDDCTISAGIYLRLPNCPMAQMLGLAWTGAGSDFVDQDGTVRARDPSAFEAGPSVLLFDRAWLEQQLGKLGLVVFWVVVGEKRLIGGPDTYADNYPGRLVLSGCAFLEHGKVRADLRGEFEKPQS